MAIALVGGHAPVPTSGPSSYAHLITGNDSEFTSTTGAWTATGGTMSRDTTYKMSGLSGSLKHVTSAAGHKVELALPGVFKAGSEYVLFLAISLEETGITAASHAVTFGVPAVDFALAGPNGWNPSVDPNVFMGSNLNWGVLGIRWKPTANRTGVLVRAERTQPDGSNTQTWHIGFAKAFRLPTPDGPAFLRGPGSFVSRIFFAPSDYSGAGQMTNHTRGGVQTYMHGGLDVDSLTFGWQGSHDWGIYNFGEFPSGDEGDLAEMGWELNVGPDYVGFYISELDSDTVQIYADLSAGYMMQLRHRGSGKGWAVSEDGAVNRRIEDSFEYRVTVAGTLTTGTDKGGVSQVIQLPFKARIDEVRCHVGTAPTGDTILVDVNAGGTTIFTTQGNRPTIAISGTDDTSGVPDGGTSIAKDTAITVDIDQVGSGTAGADLTVWIRGTAIW